MDIDSLVNTWSSRFRFELWSRAGMLDELVMETSGGESHSNVWWCWWAILLVLLVDIEEDGGLVRVLNVTLRSVITPYITTE